jgi:hypothetical protein
MTQQQKMLLLALGGVLAAGGTAWYFYSQQEAPRRRVFKVDAENFRASLKARMLERPRFLPAGTAAAA